MKKLIVFFLCLSCALWCVSSCKKKGDPCLDMDFRMYYNYGVYDNVSDTQPNKKQYVADTILNGQVVYFEAQPGADVYEWLIGLETTPRKGQNLRIPFNVPGDPPYPITIDVTLTAKYNSENNCNNYPDGKKVVKKKFCIMPQALYLGKFYGTDTKAPNNPYTVEIFYDNLGEVGWSYFIKDLATPFYSTDPIMAFGISTYREFFVWRSLNDLRWNRINDQKAVGNCKIQGNRIEINYNMWLSSNLPNHVDYENRTFIGTRVP